MQERYSRQILFSGVGEEGQRKIREKQVLIIGAGALGAANAEAIVRAGVGKVTIADRDYVEWSNLQRQQLYTEEDAKQYKPKAIAAAEHLQAINSEVEINPVVTDVTVQEMEELVRDVDLILDATDNFETRLLINDISQKYNIPWIYGGCVGSYGVTYTILPGKTPCFRCLMEHPASGATCDTAGIIQPAVQLVVAHQITEALKILVEDFGALRETMLSFDLWNNQQMAFKVNRQKKDTCLSCGRLRTYPSLTFEAQTKTEVLCGRNTVQIRPGVRKNFNLEEIKKRLQRSVEIKATPYLLSFPVEEYRFVLFTDGRAFIHGTNDMNVAKSLYARYIG
ncbi:thiamine biosynthesis protein MoeB [Bacillus thuringiensis]|uniref:molybdopterin-synthase adenylyltransferase MoeB n=1 Tax=Bacillus thuringiensis TaxID=1428 RepID=UPI000BEBAB38|nr:molybdopterin-synthase adenylyltransferase MoeB [Bacillus thuringiensis]HDR8141546.1 molybdopterin-synthase adenylyltransferase MoeB [Bacillus cereus]MED3310251.1 molybdopterin-synthase adenylyltransferase MoeB [Bacillus thuringiensis]PDZ64321.1 thiamine biosynthesis protein MoeB [Bacillus thuringiensis]PFT07911.1 thiamine biosynthesis protein MoeB [Bacillus thuringiensis]PFU57908.1 thiamine biosynthesis protein MoeB [Bacillus thuringiensis]